LMQPRALASSLADPKETELRSKSSPAMRAVNSPPPPHERTIIVSKPIDIRICRSASTHARTYHSADGDSVGSELASIRHRSPKRATLPLPRNWTLHI